MLKRKAQKMGKARWGEGKGGGGGEEEEEEEVGFMVSLFLLLVESQPINHVTVHSVI